MPVIKTEYVLARRMRNMNWKGEKFDIMYLEERYAAEMTGYLSEAFKTTDLEYAKQRMDELRKSGYAQGFKVMALKTSLTTV